MQSALKVESDFSRKDWLLLGLLVLALLLLFYLTYNIDELFVPLLLSILLQFLLSPIVDNLERRGISRGSGILLTYVGFLAIFFIGGYLLFIQMREDFAMMLEPEFIEKLQSKLLELDTQLKANIPFLKDSNMITGLIDGSGSGSSTADIVTGMLSTLVGIIVLVPLLTYYFLKDGRDIKKSLLGLVPNRYFEMAVNMEFKVEEKVGNFIRSRIVEIIAVSVVTVIGLWLVGLKFYLLLGIFAGVMNFIPYVGPLIGAVPALAIAVTQDFTMVQMGMLAGVYIAAQIVDNALVIPLLVAKIVNQHPLTVIILVIIGAALMGIIGMIIIMPIFSILQAVITEYYQGLKSLRG